MDQRTEEQVISNLRTALQGKTVIVITHRASLLALVDRLIIMDHGTLVAEGPRDAVLERLNRGDIKVSRE
jgi:ATP-binding cassette subfamily C protein LapB